MEVFKKLTMDFRALFSNLFMCSLLIMKLRVFWDRTVACALIKACILWRVAVACFLTK